MSKMIFSLDRLQILIVTGVDNLVAFVHGLNGDTNAVSGLGGTKFGAWPLKCGPRT
jgi:hypothetical protein